MIRQFFDDHIAANGIDEQTRGWMPQQILSSIPIVTKDGVELKHLFTIRRYIAFLEENDDQSTVQR